MAQFDVFRLRTGTVEDCRRAVRRCFSARVLARLGPRHLHALYGLGRAFGRDRTRRAMLIVPLIDADDVDRAEGWFADHGDKAVLIGRLIPGVRSLISLPAGVSAMPLGKFTILTLIGSAIWNFLLIFSGWLLGTQYHIIEAHIDTANNIIYALIGASIAVFIMRRLNRRRKDKAAQPS